MAKAGFHGTNEPSKALLRRARFHGTNEPSRAQLRRARFDAHTGIREDIAPHTGIPKPFIPGGKLGKAVRDIGPNPPLNVLGLQHFLRNKGYNIAADGKLGPQTRQALRDAIMSGRMPHPSQADMHAIHGMHGEILSPKNFDAMISHAGRAPYKPLVGSGNHGMLDHHGNLSMSTGPSNAKVQSGGSVNAGPTQKALKGSAGHNIDPNEANFGQLFNVDKTAQAMAQEQFQPQINDQQLLVNRDPRQAAQNEADVRNWYNQVTGAQKAAGTADARDIAQGVNATDAQTKALVNSLGGSANQGAGLAAAAGENAAGTLAAIGASQQGLDSELAPILAAQAAQQKTNQRNIDQTKQADDLQALQNLQGQEGNAQTNAQEQLQSANNSLDQARQQALLQIQQYNNSLAQQKYQNQLGLLSTQVAAQMNGVNMAKDAAEANYYQARAAAAGGSGGRSASQLNDVQRQLMAALGSKGMIVSPSSGVYKLAPGVTPGQALAFSKNFVSQYGGLPGNFLPGTLGAIQGY